MRYKLYHYDLRTVPGSPFALQPQSSVGRVASSPFQSGSQFFPGPSIFSQYFRDLFLVFTRRGTCTPFLFLTRTQGKRLVIRFVLLAGIQGRGDFMSTYALFLISMRVMFTHPSGYGGSNARTHVLMGGDGVPARHVLLFVSIE